jgi:ABC-type uncharacterized transport system involved in gliding motility auxiliary subunit
LFFLELAIPKLTQNFCIFSKATRRVKLLALNINYIDTRSKKIKIKIKITVKTSIIHSLHLPRDCCSDLDLFHVPSASFAAAVYTTKYAKKESDWAISDSQQN